MKSSKRLSLHPLDPERALAAFLAVKLPKKGAKEKGKPIKTLRSKGKKGTRAKG